MKTGFDSGETPDQTPVPLGEGLHLNLQGFEGPLDLLLGLARDQKVDLRQISILQLAEQYLAYIAAARRIRLEIAADYLVMAAWLAYLKSRLLLPEQERPEEEGPSAEEQAANLAFQLRRLEAMRQASERLLAMNQLGRDIFMRGQPEGIRIIRKSVYACEYRDLLKAYGDFLASRGSSEVLTLRAARRNVFSVEEALERLSRLIGQIPDWTTLQSFLPSELTDPFAQRSALASTFNATLEMAKQGQIELRQAQTFGPIYLRRREGSPDSAAGSTGTTSPDNERDETP